MKTLVSSLSRKHAAVAGAAVAILFTCLPVLAQQAVGQPGVAQQGPNPKGANASKYHVAVVDISYIFKNHRRFKATMEGMKKEMDGIEAELKADRAKIAEQEQQRNQYNAGTAEFKQLDEEIARQMAEFNLKMGKLRKDFLEREAKVYYQTYLEVVDAITYYAQRQSIGLVLRFNGDPIDPNKREDVLREINKPVVVQDKIDITGDILVMINRDQPAAQPAQPQIGGRPQAPSQLPPR